MRKRRISVLPSIMLIFSLILGSAVVGNAASRAPRDKVLIGIVNPLTGGLAGFGEGTPWTEHSLADWINKDGGIYFKEYDRKLPIEIKLYDSESDPNKAAQMAQRLIQDDKIDLMVVRHTPLTVLPVSNVCERYSMPTVSLDMPMEPWLAEGPHKWVFHAFWSFEQMYSVYSNMWKMAGFGKGSKIGLHFLNDADAEIMHPMFVKKIKDEGMILTDPGLYPALTADYSTIINRFMREGVEVICGLNINPDFATFARQCRQLGFKPKFSVQCRAVLFESDAMAVGVDLMDGVTTEVWWSPYHPFKSELTGETPGSLAEKYKAVTGRNIPATVGFKYASMEIAIDALSRAGSLDKMAIRDAIAATDLQTIVGPIKYDPKTQSCPTVVVGGQWVKNAQGGLDLNIVENSTAPNVPITAKLKPLPQ